jgi:hypothetical protein
MIREESISVYVRHNVDEQTHQDKHQKLNVNCQATAKSSALETSFLRAS